MIEHPVNEPFMHEGRELITILDKRGDCTGCFFKPTNEGSRDCYEHACMRSERGDGNSVHFITLDQFYIRRLKGLT